MSRPKDLEPSQVLEMFGELIAALSAFASKVPAKSMMAPPGGFRPPLETVDAYETLVYRFRDRAGSIYKGITPFFIESLEAFEAGRVFDAVPHLRQVVDQLVSLHKEEIVKFTQGEQDRVREFHRRLDKILPDTTKPEVDLPPPTSY